MPPRLLSLGLSPILLAVIGAQLVAQQPYAPYSSPLPPPLLPPLSASPLASDVLGWPAEELLPAEPGAPPLVGDETMIAQATESWIDTYAWFLPGEISGGLELGINGSAGNSEALSFKTGFDLKHKTEADELKFNLTYNKATAYGVETQHNAIFNASYERMLGGSKWNLFVKEFVEYDEFKAFDLRIAINAGIGYHVIKTETTSWKTRFGAGGSTEIGGPNDNWVPEGVFGTDFERQLTKRQKCSLTSDYYPDWSDFTNYRVVTMASYEVMLNEEYNLNLKLSANDRYDSTPNGRKPNDINYSILLLWKM